MLLAMNPFTSAVLVIVCASVPEAARADHLPERLHATGKAETRLAGIAITRTANISDAIKRFGPPTEKKTAENNPVWIGYRWNLQNANLEVSASSGHITSVYVEASGTGPSLGTGAGVKLGDDFRRLEATYGERYSDRTYPDMRVGGESRERAERIPFSGVRENRRIKIQWRSPEYTLTAGLDEHGKVRSLWLLRPECFPGECE